MRVISKTGADSVEYPPGSGNVYEAGTDGVFDMPESVGRELTGKHASMWVAETEFEAAQNAADLDRLRDPNILVAAVNDLLKRLAVVEGKVAAPVKAKAPAAEQTPPAEQPQQAEQAPPAKKTAGARQGAAAKKTPAKKTAAGKGPAETPEQTDAAAPDGEPTGPEQPGGDPAP